MVDGHIIRYRTVSLGQRRTGDNFRQRFPHLEETLVFKENILRRSPMAIDLPRRFAGIVGAHYALMKAVLLVLDSCKCNGVLEHWDASRVGTHTANAERKFVSISAYSRSIICNASRQRTEPRADE